MKRKAITPMIESMMMKVRGAVRNLRRIVNQLERETDRSITFNTIAIQ